MPIKKCSDNGKGGYKWGDSGYCYTGPGAKKKAIKQGLAIGKGKLVAEELVDISENELEEASKELLQEQIQEYINGSTNNDSK